MEQGHSISPRGSKTLELISAGFSLTRPRQRCITTKERRWSLPLAIGEFCWHASGSEELSPLEYYAPRWREFASANARIVGSAYGKRVFRQERGASQWERVTHLLRVDPESRRAILNIQQSPAEALDPASKDVACASTLQFLVRDNALHAIVYMRSNDIIWGLPYDVFLFTMLQEMLACTLKLELGTYHHVAASLHLYERHFDLAERVLASPQPPMFEMPPMNPIDELPLFLETEKALRTGEDIRTLDSAYWQELTAPLKFYRLQSEGASAQADLIVSKSLYEPVLRPLTTKPQ
ncbi:thymidylate synthase [Melittangium boletus]|uniref:thymidylate synthase n=1 Tax=Melittangium boletus TaxID=83453 RepID=UPI003DA3B053